VQEEGLAVGGEALHPLVGEGAGADLERGVIFDPRLRCRQLLRPVRHVLLEDGEEEVGLAGEVGVDGTVRVARSLGDLLHRGALVAALGKDARGRGDQLCSGARLLLGSGLAFGQFSHLDYEYNLNCDTNLVWPLRTQRQLSRLSFLAVGLRKPTRRTCRLRGR